MYLIIPPNNQKCPRHVVNTPRTTETPWITEFEVDGTLDDPKTPAKLFQPNLIDMIA